MLLVHLGQDRTPGNIKTNRRNVISFRPGRPCRAVCRVRQSPCAKWSRNCCGYSRPPWRPPACPFRQSFRAPVQRRIFVSLLSPQVDIGFITQPPYLIHVNALDADQPRRRPAAGRMQIALVIEPGHARGQLVRANRARLARLLRAGRRDELVVGHLGFALRLAVDRPRRAMIVRRRILRAVVRVREDAEAELRVLVKEVPFRRLVVQTGLNEAFIQQGSLETRAELAPPGRSRILLENVAAFACELLQRRGNGAAPYLRLSVQSNPAYCSLTRPRRRSTRSTAASSSSRVSTNSSTPLSPPKSAAYQRSSRGMTTTAPPASMRTEWRTYEIEASSNWTSSCPPSNTRSGGDERHAECIAKWIRSS